MSWSLTLIRICSLVPSATEILYALGLGEAIVGVSHECDYPPEALQKPKILRTLIAQEQLTSAEIDRTVHGFLERREPLYQLDEEALRRLQPDLIFTQALCEVCAVGSTQVLETISRLPIQPKVVSLHPHTIRELLGEIRLMGRMTGCEAEAERVVQPLQERIERVAARVKDAPSPRVFWVEGLDPLMATGHWVPEMVELAGDREVLGRAGEPSRYVTWQEALATGPEVLCLMPCGFSIERTRSELSSLTKQPWWNELPAVRSGQVFLLNGPAYFNCAGPRLIDGIELLARILHPDPCAGRIPPSESAVAKL